VTHHTEILLQTTRTLQERTKMYGSPLDTYTRAATIASTVLGKALTAYDIVMILHAVKLSRIPTGRDVIDHYEDGINYLAFAAEFAGASDQKSALAWKNAVADAEENLKKASPLFQVPEPTLQFKDPQTRPFPTVPQPGLEQPAPEPKSEVAVDLDALSKALQPGAAV
jgi:hypothetical protein